MLKKLLIALAVSALAGCAGAPIDTFTHADLQNAAKIAVTPARAAVWTAADNALTAQENIDAAVAAQAKACANSLKLLKPNTSFGVATAIESAAGATPVIDANCKPISVVITGKSVF